MTCVGYLKPSASNTFALARARLSQGGPPDRFGAGNWRTLRSQIASVGNLFAAARPAEVDREVVADQSPAAPRQDGRTAGQTREVLLAPAGGESPDAAAVRVDAPALGAARADRLTDVVAIHNFDVRARSLRRP